MASHLRIWNTNRRVRLLSSAVSAVAVALLPFVAGCSDDDPVTVEDIQAPFPPDGVFSVTGDGLVSVYWNDNWEEDLAGYAVYRCDPTAYACDTPQAPYDYLGEVPASQTWYDDTNLNNGETWFYAVAAFDVAGNVSDLSYELVFDTPRPAGVDVALVDCLGQNSGMGGFDFSSRSILLCSDMSKDIYFEASGGVNHIVAAPGVDIQDFGWTFSLDDLDWAPAEKGWAPSGRVEAIPEHGYFVRIISGTTNYAKIRVTGVTGGSITLDWAYQTDPGNPELAPGAEGGASK